VEAMTYAVFEAGSAVCRQGETAARMFLLMAGACTVSVSGGGGGGVAAAAAAAAGAAEGEKRVVGRLGPFDVFGESALMSGKKLPVRGATVTADVDSQVLVLSRAAVPALVKAGHLDREWGARMKKMYRARKKENAAQ
jgi:CRP-like cAMP-binding protein